MSNKGLEKTLDWWINELKGFNIDHEPYNNVYCCNLSEAQVVNLRNMLISIRYPIPMSEEKLDEYLKSFVIGYATMFVEEKGTGFARPVVLHIFNPNPKRCDINYYDSIGECYYPRNRINKTWRVWKEKPTAEMMENTPWLK